MSGEMRLRGRKLIMGSELLFVLTLSVGIMLVFSLSLLPVVYKSEAANLELNKYINLLASAVMLAVVISSYNALKTGADRYMFKKAQSYSPTAKDIFFYFSPRSFFSLLYVKCRIFLLRAMIFILMNMPCFMCSVLLFNLSTSRFSLAVTTVLAGGVLVFFISGVYFYLQISSSLFMVKYYYIKGEYVSFRHLIASSQSAMKGRSAELLKLRISFMGWFLSCVFILPVGYVWSYYNQTLSAYADKITKLQ